MSLFCLHSPSGLTGFFFFPISTVKIIFWCLWASWLHGLVIYSVGHFPLNVMCYFFFFFGQDSNFFLSFSSTWLCVWMQIFFSSLSCLKFAKFLASVLFMSFTNFWKFWITFLQKFFWIITSFSSSFGNVCVSVCTVHIHRFSSFSFPCAWVRLGLRQE